MAKLLKLPLTGDINGHNGKSNGKKRSKQNPAFQSRFKTAAEAARAGSSTQAVIPVKMVDVDGVKKVGRGSEYREDFCDLLVHHMAGGNTIESFAAVCHVSISTLHSWVRLHPELREAKEIGEPYRLLWWMELMKSVAVDDPSHQLEVLGVKPFLKKHTIKTKNTKGGGSEEEEVMEWHVPRGNVAMICFMVSNMFRNEGWNNPQRVEVTGKDGEPIKHEHTVLNPKVVAQLSLDELRTIHRVNALQIEYTEAREEATE